MSRLALSLLMGSALALAEAPSLVSSWQSNCYAFPIRHSFIADLSVTAEAMDIVINMYADSACATPTLTITGAADYSPGGPQSEAFAITIQPKSIFVTLVHPDVVKYYNAHQTCGLSDWRLNVTKELTGYRCDARVLPISSETVSDIYDVREKILRFGNFPLPALKTPARHLNPALWFRAQP